MNFRHLDLNLLLVLMALFEERSVTAVARRLKVSQPTVSSSLSKLRVVLEDELFVRTATGMQPTARAEELHEPLRQIIETIEREILRSTAFAPFNTTQTFTVAMSDIGELVLVPPLLARLRAVAPRASLRCRSMPPAELAAALENGDVDLAIGYFPDLKAAGLFQQSLFKHPFVCLVRPDHPTIVDSISLEQFLTVDHAVANHNGRSQELFERVMRELGMSPRILLNSMHYMSLPQIIANSDMIAIVPRAVGTSWGQRCGVRCLELPIDIPLIEIKQFWHARLHNDTAGRWLRGLVSELFVNRDPTHQIDAGPSSLRHADL